MCETCLRSGKLIEVNVSTCEGNQLAIAAQLADRRDDLVAEAREALVQERSILLMHCTPGLQTWQDFRWPAHCGDYCEFVEELGKPELVELAGDADPQAWFLAHADGANPSVWKSVRERSARARPRESYDLSVYRFVCRECAETILHWDAN